MIDKFSVIIQARVSSKRFFGKVLKKIGKKTILEIIIQRIKKSNKIDKIVVATTKNKEDLKIISLAKKLKVNYYKGSENNVLERYYFAAKKFNIKNIIRVTADCPFTDPEIIDDLISIYKKNSVSYASNIIYPTFPDGLDLEIIDFNLLRERYY